MELLLDTVRPDRLGHGVRAVEDPRVLRRIVDAGVGLEVCPSSNVGLGVYPDVAAVPLRTLLAAGARMALGADDPLLFRARLTAQYELARDRHGLDDVALAGLARASIELSRAPTPVRARLLDGVADWLRQDAGTAAGTAGVRSRQGSAEATTG